MRVPVIAVALCLIPIVAAPQSLGEAARRQARRRTTRAPATNVFTDKDLKPQGEEPGPDPAEPPATAGNVAGVRVSDATRVATPAPAGEDAMRAQLDRDAELRRRQELAWRREAVYALSWLTAAQRQHDVVCGPGVLVLTGG